MATLATYPAHRRIFPICCCRAYVNKTDAIPEIALRTITPMRRLLSAFTNAFARVLGSVVPLAAIIAATKMTPRAIAPMTPTKNNTIARTTFREWPALKAFRPRITNIAPISKRSDPRRPMPNGIHDMSPPISSRRRHVFVRPTCFCRSASQGDAPYPYPGYAGYAGGGVGAPPAGGIPPAIAAGLPQFAQKVQPA